MTRNILLSIAAAVLTCGAASASEQPDTIKTEPGTIVTKTADGKTIITVTDADGQVKTTKLSAADSRIIVVDGKKPNQPKSHPGGWHFSSWGFNFGWNFATGLSPVNPVEPGKSLEIGWLNMIGTEYRFSRSTALSIGFGMNWRNFKITTPDYRFVETGKQQVALGHYPEGVEPRNSRLKIFTLLAPVMIKQRLPFRLYGQKQWIAAGIVPGYAPHGSLLTRWRNDAGKNEKISSNKVGHRRWTYELMGILGVSSDIGVYFSYQPVSVLRGAGQPDFKSFSTGLLLVY